MEAPNFHRPLRSSMVSLKPIVVLRSTGRPPVGKVVICRNRVTVSRRCAVFAFSSAPTQRQDSNLHLPAQVTPFGVLVESQDALSVELRCGDGTCPLTQRTPGVDAIRSVSADYGQVAFGIDRRSLPSSMERLTDRSRASSYRLLRSSSIAFGN